jgi:branched-subunit amino acid permease
MIEYKKLINLACTLFTIGVIFFSVALFLPQERNILETWINRYETPILIIGMIFIIMSVIVYYKTTKYPKNMKKIK